MKIHISVSRIRYASFIHALLYEGQLIWINCTIICLLSNYNLLDQAFKYHSVKLVKNISVL